MNQTLPACCPPPARPETKRETARRLLRAEWKRNPPPPGHREVGDAVRLLRKARKLLLAADELHADCRERYCWCGDDVQGIAYMLRQAESALVGNVLGCPDAWDDDEDDAATPAAEDDEPAPAG